MSEKSEWPSASHLADLREQGIVPYSSFSTACIGTAALVISLYILEGRILSVIAKFRQQCAGDDFSLLQLFNRLESDLVVLLLVPVLTVLVVRWLWGLLQTRFLFSASKLAFRFQFGLPAGDRLWRRAARYLLLLAACVLIVLLSFRYLFSDVMVLLNNDRTYWLAWPRHFLQKFLPILTGVLVCAGLVAWLWNRLAFMFEHRTTRGELYRDFE
jgi:flagellar biosynthesis protein FlhB